MTQTTFTPATGTGNDAAAIQAAIDAAAAVGGGLVLVPAGAWSIGATLVLKSGVRLAAAGRGTLLQSAAGLGAVIQGSAIQDFTVEGFEIAGTHAPGAQDTNFHGIYLIGGTQRGALTRNRVRDFHGNGIELGSCTNVQVTENHVSNCRVGISLFKNNHHVDVDRNYLTLVREVGINVDDATTGDTDKTAQSNQDCTVTRNRIVQMNPTVTPDGYGAVGIACQGSVYIQIVGNHVLNGGQVAGAYKIASGIVVNGGQENFKLSRFVTVAHNVVRNNTSAGIVVMSAVGVDVHANHLVGNWVSPGAVLAPVGEIEIREGASGGQLHDNTIVRTAGSPNELSRTTHGVVVYANVTALNVGVQRFTGCDENQRYRINSPVEWTGVESLSAEPATDPLLPTVQSGRRYFDLGMGFFRQHNGGGWVNL